MTPVATPAVEGVQIKRHVLDTEARRLAMLARRVGIRLRKAEIARVEVTTFGVRDKGKDEWLEHAEWYRDTVLGLLREQRARAAMKDGRPPMSDAEYEQAVNELVVERVRRMTEAEVQAMRARPTVIELEEPAHAQ